MSDVTVGLLNPGEMGAAVGQCLTGAGHQVLWAAEGRSPATRERAEAAGLTASGITDIAARCDVVLSVCPPHAAHQVALQVARAGFGGLYVDANAISPASAREVATVVGAAGADYVDGGIIGSPPVTPGFIRLYLSGPRAQEVRALFTGSPADVRVIGDDTAPAASAVKMAYASWTKGTAAMVLAARALARAEGVEDTLLAEWEQSQPGLEQRTERAAGSAAGKGWRWVAEMEEIAATMAAAGLPDGFHLAAAEIYRRSPHDADASLEAVLSAIRQRLSSRGRGARTGRPPPGQARSAPASWSHAHGP
jgi:3-hydroxyisobutyrate dehydrogenase-like beta-hydroxyacid dehydrogenase